MGEVSVAQDELNSFLNVAEELRIKGLTQGNQNQVSPPKSNPNTVPQMNKISTHPVSNLPPRQQKQVFRDQKESEIQNIPVIKSEPREPVHQKVPARPYQDQKQVRYEHQTEQEVVHGQVYDDTIGQHIEEGTVAIDDTYIDDGGYDYQYDDTTYEDTEENVAYHDGKHAATGMDNVP